MAEKEIPILGINPGTKYLGFAVFNGPELRDWGIKTLKGRWSAKKIATVKGLIGGLFSRYGIRRLSLKKLHPSRSSGNLQRLSGEIVRLASGKGIEVGEHAIGEVEAFFAPEGPRINRRKLCELVARDYPPLYLLLEREKKNRNSYYLRLFEAVALGALAYHLSRR